MVGGCGDTEGRPVLVGAAIPSLVGAAIPQPTICGGYHDTIAGTFLVGAAILKTKVFRFQTSFLATSVGCLFH